MSYKWWLPVVALVGLFVAPGGAEDKKPEPERIPDHVRYTVEIRGTLEVAKDIVRVRVFLWAGCLFAAYEVWDVDFGKDDELRKSAAKLHGKTVVVTGEPKYRVPGNIESSLPPPTGFTGTSKEPQPPPRQSVRVKSLKAAESK